MFKTALVQSGQFRVVERARVVILSVWRRESSTPSNHKTHQTACYATFVFEDWSNEFILPGRDRCADHDRNMR